MIHVHVWRHLMSRCCWQNSAVWLLMIAEWNHGTCLEACHLALIVFIFHLIGVGSSMLSHYQPGDVMMVVVTGGGGGVCAGTCANEAGLGHPRWTAVTSHRADCWRLARRCGGRFDLHTAAGNYERHRGCVDCCTIICCTHYALHVLILYNNMCCPANGPILTQWSMIPVVFSPSITMGRAFYLTLFVHWAQMPFIIILTWKCVHMFTVFTLKPFTRMFSFCVFN